MGLFFLHDCRSFGIQRNLPWVVTSLEATEVWGCGVAASVLTHITAIRATTAKPIVPLGKLLLLVAPNRFLEIAGDLTGGDGHFADNAELILRELGSSLTWFGHNAAAACQGIRLRSRGDPRRLLELKAERELFRFSSFDSWSDKCFCSSTRAHTHKHTYKFYWWCLHSRYRGLWSESRGEAAAARAGSSGRAGGQSQPKRL
jgi:hypothetical protein